MANKPTLTIVAGYAGSGKTELSKAMARLTRWTLLDKDTLTRPLVEALAANLCGDPDDRQSEQYFGLIRPLEYQALMHTAHEILEMGSSVIVTAPFIRELFNAEYCEDLLFQIEVEEKLIKVVWVFADEGSMKQRLVRRGAGRDRWKLANWDEYISSIDIDSRPRIPHHWIDNSFDATGSIGSYCSHLVEVWMA